MVYKYIQILCYLLVSGVNANMDTNAIMDTNANVNMNLNTYNDRSLFVPFYNFRVCGAYCGPGWCNNMWLSEDKCNTTVDPEYHKLTGFSCADSCCKIHDHCCGQDKKIQHNCNNEIVDCLSKCDPFSITCTYDFIPTLASEIEFAMNIVRDWCCGTPC